MAAHEKAGAAANAPNNIPARRGAVITLRQGDRGPAVLELQMLLAMTGHDPGPLDGVFGPRTQAATAAYLDERYGRVAARAFDPGSVDTEDVARLRTLPRRAVELPRILTPIAAVDMRIALVAGYADAFATREVRVLPIRVALAQLAVEHGCGPWRVHPHVPSARPLPWTEPVLGQETYVNVWNFNVGNRQVRGEDRDLRLAPLPLGGQPSLDPHGAPQVPWFAMSPVEGSGASAHRATSAHYAYANAAEGASAYWRFLRDHCASALAAFERGDPAAAAHELKHGGWGYSGDEGDYARGMVDRFRGIE